MNDIICWCNHNEGFLNAILSFIALVISIIATWIAIAANNNQIRSNVLGQRLDIYYQINRIYIAIKQFTRIEPGSSLIEKRTHSYYIIYGIGTKEFETCGRLVSLEKRIQSLKQSTGNSTEREIEVMEKEYRSVSDELVPSIVSEEALVDRIKSLFQLLYPEKAYSKIIELLDAYDYIFLSHSCLANNEFLEKISEMKALITEIDGSNLMERIQKDTFKIK